MARTPLIAGNWKMNAGGAEACVLAANVATLTANFGRVEVLVAPPFTALAAPVPAAIQAENRSHAKAARLASVQASRTIGTPA